MLQLKSSLLNVQYVCTTADVWTQQARSYLGVTCHWIDPATLSRRSAVLAFRRFLGVHSYDKIGNMLMSIHNQYDLDTSKITHVVTDHGSNFVKAFKIFAHGDDDDGNIIASDDNNEAEYVYESNFDILLNGHDDESGSAIYLPPHTSCLAHTLNLLRSCDAEKAVAGDGQYKKLYRSVAAKCVALSNAVHMSSKNSEAAKDILSKTIPKPNSTRWNSEYDSFKCIYEMRDKVNVLMERLKLPRLVDLELDFLAEWLEVMGPVATALDKLQGENTVDSYYGAIMPALLAIKRRLDSYVPSTPEP